MRPPKQRALAAALQSRSLLEIPALPGRTNHRHAGILVPLRWTTGGLHCIVTERAHHLRTHPGEVSFPGGRPEPEDADLTATALREAREELGIEHATPLGPLSAMPLFTSDYRLVPTVADVGLQALEADPGEVARVLEIDVMEIVLSESIPAMGWPGWPPSPVFELDGVLMFGGTAHTLHELLGVVADLLNRPLPPCDPSAYTWDFDLSRPRRLR